MSDVESWTPSNIYDRSPCTNTYWVDSLIVVLKSSILYVGRCSGSASGFNVSSGVPFY